MMMRMLAKSLLIGLLVTGGIRGADAATTPELRIYSWEGYLDDKVLAEFGRAHGVVVRVHYFNSDTERDVRLVETDGKGYDIVTINGAMIEPYRKRGWLAPLEPASMPNLANSDARWRDAFPGARTHAVPFVVGTLGILYRADRVPGGFDSWLALFKPKPEMCGRIWMGGDSRELINTALKAAGASSSSRDPQHYKAAESLLVGQKRCVAEYQYPTVELIKEFQSRDTVAAMAFSCDAVEMAEADPRLKFVVPREGAGFWVDYHAVLSSSPNRRLALELLDYMNRPAVHARMARTAYSMPASTAAIRLLPNRMRADPVIFPGAAVLARSELDAESPPNITRIRNAIFSRVVH